MLMLLTFSVLFVRIQQPVVQRDIFINHRAEMFASVDVVGSNGDTKWLLVGEVFILLDDGLTERDRS